jgi:hypothetical protein
MTAITPIPPIPRTGINSLGNDEELFLEPSLSDAKRTFQFGQAAADR